MFARSWKQECEQLRTLLLEQGSKSSMDLCSLKFCSWCRLVSCKETSSTTNHIDFKAYLAQGWWHLWTRNLHSILAWKSQDLLLGNKQPLYLPCWSQLVYAVEASIVFNTSFWRHKVAKWHYNRIVSMHKYFYFYILPLLQMHFISCSSKY